MEGLLVCFLVLAGLHTAAQVEGWQVNVERHLAHLTTHRYPNEEYRESRRRTEHYISECFEEYGLAVYHQAINAFASPDPANPEKPCAVEGLNIIGVSGQEREEAGAVVVVGAAYDSTGLGSPLHDNGAGVAVLLEVARAYQSSVFRPRLSTLFVAFDLSVDNYYVASEEEEKQYEEDEGEGERGGGEDNGDSLFGPRRETEHSGERRQRRREGAEGAGGGGRRSSGGGLPGGWFMVQDYLRNFLRGNTTSFGGAIVLGPLLNVNHGDHSQGLDARLQELFPAAHEEVASGSYRGDFVAMVTKGGEGDEAALTLGRQLRESFREVGGRVVEFSLGNRSHSLLPPALHPRQAANFWGSTRRGRVDPLHAVLLTDTEESRQWPPEAPAPSTHLTRDQRAFLHATVASLSLFLLRRDPQQELTDWRMVGLVSTLVAVSVVNALLILRLCRLCASGSGERHRKEESSSSDGLISKERR